MIAQTNMALRILLPAGGGQVGGDCRYAFEGFGRYVSGNMLVTLSDDDSNSSTPTTRTVSSCLPSGIADAANGLKAKISASSRAGWLRSTLSGRGLARAGGGLYLVGDVFTAKTSLNPGKSFSEPSPGGRCKMRMVEHSAAILAASWSRGANFIRRRDGRRRLQGLAFLNSVFSRAIQMVHDGVVLKTPAKAARKKTVLGFLVGQKKKTKRMFS